MSEVTKFATAVSQAVEAGRVRVSDRSLLYAVI